MNEIPQWLSLVNAARVLDEPVASLRRKIEQSARVRNGRVEADVDGLLCRKFGNLWKVQLGIWGVRQ